MTIKYWTREGHFEAARDIDVPFTRLHRVDGPAAEYPSGHREWFLNGQRHRIGGPAVEYSDGAHAWWLNGKLHRADGPAVEGVDGTYEWWANGQLHRMDGPAIKNVGGARFWFLFGCSVMEEEHKAAVAKGELYVKMKYG